MSVTSFIRRCLDVGMPLDMALAAGAAFEIEAPLFVPAKSKGALRMAKHRANKASRVTDSDACDEPSKDVSPTPPSENPSPPKGPLKGPQKVPLPSNLTEPGKPSEVSSKPLSVWVAEIWEITPRPGRERSGRPALETALKAAIRRGADPEAIKRGLVGYYGSDDATHDAGKYAKGVAVVVSSGRWEAFAEEDHSPTDDDPDPWQRRLRGWTANGYWNSEWGPKPGKPGHLGPEPQARAA